MISLEFEREVNLRCPHCREFFLHHGTTVVFDRDKEDSDEGRQTRVGQDVVTTSDTSEAGGNPSRRRDGITIEFSCELCPGVSTLAIAQNKGLTQIYWLDIPMEVDQDGNSD